MGLKYVEVERCFVDQFANTKKLNYKRFML